MLLWNYSVIHKSPLRFRAGLGAISSVEWRKNGSMRAIHTSPLSPKLWWMPTGYGEKGWMLPRVAGYVVWFSEIQLGQSGTAVMGINWDGGTTIVLSGTADLSLISSWKGLCTISLTIWWDMAAALYWTGNSTVTLNGTGTLWAIAFSTWESLINITAEADITALGYMTGTMSPFTELSPQWLAQAVWQALATENNIAWTMWGKLNTASSGWVDLNALAQAVWQYGVRTLTTSGWLTVEQAEQLSATFKKGDILLNLEDILISPV